MYAIFVRRDSVIPGDVVPKDEEGVELLGTMVAYAGTFTLDREKVVQSRAGAGELRRGGGGAGAADDALRQRGRHLPSRPRDVVERPDRRLDGGGR